MEEKEIIEQRKLVPVAAMVSAGKSKLLNVLYNTNILYCHSGIGTKFVNILRYNPKIKKPCFYHLKLEKQKDKYIFYKDLTQDIYEGEESITEANKNINQCLRAELETKYEDLFYMTEINEVPFIKDKEYLLSHDLCDIPGLSEYQNNNNEIKEKEKEIEKPREINNIKEIEKEKTYEKGIKEFGLIINMENDFNIKEEKIENKKENDLNEEKNSENNKEKDKNIDEDIYSKIDIEHEHTYLTEIFKIIKNSIDGAIIILSIENYQKLENFEIIAKLHKIIGKEITNFLIILNKMDLSLNPKNDIQKCKGLLIQNFQKFKTFNINLNTFIPLSVDQLKNELLMEKSFKHLINYHFYNYMSKKNEEKNTKQTSSGKSFIDHLSDIIKTVGNIKKEEIESKVEELNEREDIENINKELIGIINDIKNNFSGSDISLGISEKDFVEAEEDELPDPDIVNESDIDICNLNPTFIIKYFYYCFDKREKLLMPTFSPETIYLLSYFTTKKEELKLENNIKNDDDKINEMTKKNREIILHLNDISKKLIESKFYIKEVDNIINLITKTIIDLKTYDVILIPFIGPTNSGKTTIINGIIGKEILPTDLNECTKRGIIIRYSNKNEEDITIRKASFKEEKCLDKTSYYFEDERLIGRGIKQVRETLQGLNLNFNKNEEDSFYYIRTKIKLSK